MTKEPWHANLIVTLRSIALSKFSTLFEPCSTRKPIWSQSQRILYQQSIPSMTSLAQVQVTDIAIERETEKTLAYLEACWAKNPVLSHLARGTSSPTKLSPIEPINQGYSKQQASALYEGCENRILNPEPTGCANNPALRIQKPFLRTGRNVRDGKLSKQLAETASHTGKQKKKAERVLSPRARFNPERLQSRNHEAKNAYSQGRKRAQLNAEEAPYAGATGPIIKTSGLPQNFGVGRLEKSEHCTFPTCYSFARVFTKVSSSTCFPTFGKVRSIGYKA